MNFHKAQFIKPNETFDSTRKDYAPLFRRKFVIDRDFSRATVRVCGLGYAYYFLNGIEISKDLFTAPFSNYGKTLWYNEYDVSKLILKGENIFAVCCGNGWYNESISTIWRFNQAAWRDFPKFILELELDGQPLLHSDAIWKYTMNSPVIYNQLREGEHFDSRLYDPKWKKLDYDDSTWNFAVVDIHPPKGKMRKCPCEPIREKDRIYPKEIHRLNDNQVVFDFGVNISGYAELKIQQVSGSIVTLRYAEEINDDYTLNFNGMNRNRFYQEGDFQTDVFICNGKEMIWSPKFTYHGFRYVELSGVNFVSPNTLTAVFVHQMVKSRSSFYCSDNRLNKLFEIGQRTTLSNLFYMPTDCPTREKMGWMNDAQASTDQMLTNYKTENLLTKWWFDICDAMTSEGMLPGVVPTPGYGYKWGNGPVSDGALFEIPYQIYLHTGNADLLKMAIPLFDRYIAFLDGCRNEVGDIAFGLDDWAAPDQNNKVDATFINSVLFVKFLRIRLLAGQISHSIVNPIQERINKEVLDLKKRYINENGMCTIEKQTAVSLLICYGIFDNLEPLKQQLIRLLKDKDDHHDCGMVGMRHLLHALNICDQSDYAYKILTSSGYPSYIDWISAGATTLYEHWDKKESHNHHMFSDYMSWIIKTILGILPEEGNPGYKIVHLNPKFILGLDFAEGYCDTINGKIKVQWNRQNSKIVLFFEVSENIICYFRGERIKGRKQIILHHSGERR